MRFIHTSDWHLGQTLHHFERRFEHQCFLDWLLATLVTEQAQTLLISGDIFDNANPSAAAQKQFYQFLQQAKARVPALNIVIIAGNHDSPGRLEMPAPFLAGMDASVIGFVPRDAAGQIDVSRLVIPLQDTQGVAAWCLAIPFLRPGMCHALPI
ncbi:exonuclease subunit SbcD [Deefgea sp. CFH1-16]|uniref:metallophosphoesterase family protein n=1 Tax=Deefgea sp. CFH1-16 TaxID=2675457 RepID=UPI0019403317|nr:exonuclease subunit SbcD [Deefgea sp. CFH1-16]